MERLRELRLSDNKTQAFMADYINVDRTTYVKYETGEREPNFETISALAKFFDVSVDYLIGHSETSITSQPQNNNRPVYDDEAWEMMREMYERPELRTLFKTSRKVKPESIKAVNELLESMAGGREDDT